MLEALVKSPVFPVLRKVVEGYRKSCYEALLTAKESSTLFEMRGRIIGVNVLENLPGLIVQQALKIKKSENKKPS